MPYGWTLATFTKAGPPVLRRRDYCGRKFVCENPHSSDIPPPPNTLSQCWSVRTIVLLLLNRPDLDIWPESHIRIEVKLNPDEYFDSWLIPFSFNCVNRGHVLCRCKPREQLLAPSIFGVFFLAIWRAAGKTLGLDFVLSSGLFFCGSYPQTLFVLFDMIVVQVGKELGVFEPVVEDRSEGNVRFFWFVSDFSNSNCGVWVWKEWFTTRQN